MKKKSRRGLLSINAGSMADIAFLMLIFFLVATTIAADKGILVKLPPFENEPIVHRPNPKNLLTIHVNADNEILLRDELIEVAQLKDKVKEFVANPQKKSNFPNSPKKAIVSLKNDRNTSYTTYIAVYDKLKAAYRELWEEHAKRTYDRPYHDLPPKAQKEIRNDYPQIISEAEPSNHQNE